MPNLRRCCATVCVLAVSGALLAGCRDDHDSSSSTATEPVPSAPPVAGDPVVDRPVFNDPNSDRTSRRAAVLLQLARLISEVPGGGSIELAMHQFDVQHAMVEKQIVRALVGRARHGVRVRVLLDGGNLGAGHTAPNHALRMLRGGFRGTNSWVATCSDRTPSIRHRGCIGSRANHNKFGLFSTVRTSNGTRYDHVVFQSSSNISDFYTTGSWNDSFTAQDAGLYAGYRDYFDDLVTARKQRSLSGYHVYWPTPYHREVNGSSRRLHAYLYPRADGTDPVIDELDRVSCDQNPTGPPGAGGALINVAMMSFTAARQPLADKLAQLAGQGCSVTVLYYPGTNDNQKAGSPAWDGKILAQLRNAHVILFPCRYRTVLHTKVMTVEGFIDGALTRETFTGSANFTSLTGFDDAWLRIVDDGTEAAYAKWMMHDLASRYCLPDDDTAPPTKRPMK